MKTAQIVSAGGIGVKTYDNAAVLARVPQRELLIPVQNGFDPQLEASNHPFEGIASFVSQCEPDRPATRITRPGELCLGGRRELTPPQREVLEALASAFQIGGCKNVRIVASIEPYKSSKLMDNAAISPLAAAAGIDNGELLRDPVRVFENPRAVVRHLPLDRMPIDTVTGVNRTRYNMHFDVIRQS